MADGDAFCRWLADDATVRLRQSMLWVETNYHVTPHGLTPRQGFAFKPAISRHPRRAWFGLRVPGVGARVWRVLK